MSEAGTTTLQTFLDRLRAGDPAARNELLAHSQRRLRLLTERMLRRFRRVRRWEAIEDICQQVQLRLYQALSTVNVVSVLDYLQLASWHIRNVLIDATRRHWGPHGLAAMHATPEPGAESACDMDPEAIGDDPEGIAAWGELHQLIQRMPEELRIVFDLVWYHGMEHGDAAELLGVSYTTVHRRWTAARLWLRASFRGELPV